MSKRKWVSKAFNPAHKGLLHRQLGIPQGHPIPVDLIERAAKKKGKLGKRARLAVTARSFH